MLSRSECFFFSSRRRHTRWTGDWSSDGALPISFSTLGCPEWNLDQILAAARESGYEGVEWRGYQAEMELPRAAIFTPETRGETRKRFRDAGLEFACLGSSVRLANPAPEVRQREKASFSEYAELARFLECPLVRVFGGNLN